MRAKHACRSRGRTGAAEVLVGSFIRRFVYVQIERRGGLTRLDVEHTSIPEFHGRPGALSAKLWIIPAPATPGSYGAMQPRRPATPSFFALQGYPVRAPPTGRRSTLWLVYWGWLTWPGMPSRSRPRSFFR